MRHAIYIAILFTICSCSLTPWVQPYERGYLADPVMNTARDPIADNTLRHVYEVRESARGAVAGAGGGCGCN